MTRALSCRRAETCLPCRNAGPAFMLSCLPCQSAPARSACCAGCVLVYRLRACAARAACLPRVLVQLRACRARVMRAHEADRQTTSLGTRQTDRQLALLPASIEAGILLGTRHTRLLAPDVSSVLETGYFMAHKAARACITHARDIGFSRLYNVARDSNHGP